MSQPRTARQYPADSYRTDPEGFGSRGTNSPLYRAYNDGPNPGHGGDGGPDRPRSKGVLIATVTAAVVVGSVLGVGGAMFYGGGSSDDAPAKAPTHTVAQIASALGCKPVDDGGKRAQLTQSACTVGSNRYTILTFDTDKDMAAWQAEAAGYGGAYLVGTRWLVVANTSDQLDPYVDKLGGDVVVDSHH
jgi:hypothetical protein